ncbi:hypothetical protein Hanom_Chr01g00014271 [Helianthus anomalus]
MQSSVSDDAGEFKVLLTRLVTRCVFKTVQRFVLMMLLTRLPYVATRCVCPNPNASIKALVKWSR